MSARLRTWARDEVAPRDATRDELELHLLIWGDVFITQANAEVSKQQKASEVADVDVVLPCGCVHPCEGHHEDES